MLSVLALSAAAQIEVELQFGGVGEPIYIVDEPQSVFPTGLNELMGMVEQMQLSQQQPYQMMQNPCTNVSATLSNHGRALTTSPPPPRLPARGHGPCPLTLARPLTFTRNFGGRTKCASAAGPMPRA